MPIGVLLDNLMVLLGGLVGGLLGKKMPAHMKDGLNQVFGFIAMGIGITLITKVNTLGAVVLSVVLGTCLGSWLKLEDRVNAIFAGLNAQMLRATRPDQEYMTNFSTLLVLCCFSGTGIFGAMNEGLSGDSTIIFCKAILDFFTVMIFATVLGKFTAVIALPQMVVLMALFFGAKTLMPLMTDTLSADFSAVGGIIELTVALRILKLSKMKAIDVLPALLLVFPVSLLWNQLIA